MISLDDYQKSHTAHTSLGMSSSFISLSSNIPTFSTGRRDQASAVPRGVPLLTLYNTNLNIRIQGINGAVIGRRQGPYAQFFEQNMYVSGVHAQLKYNATTGWCIVDKHSSNGTTLNQHALEPDVEMSLKNGDIVGLANINLQVSIN
jgi:pSer/pThr/pTyr-binding forkhead associated (FHA) protein